MNRTRTILCLFVITSCRLAGAPVAEVDNLVARLADPSFASRQQAGKHLRDLAAKRRAEVESALVRAYRHSADPEIRFMSREILTDLFESSLGYLGVAFAKREYMDSDGKKQWVIGVNAVQPDSPATHAGLRVGDLILRLDGKDLGPDAEIDFPKRIKSTGSGKAVVFMIERDGEEKRIPVTLGSWPYPITAVEANALFASRIRELESPPAR